MSPEILARVGHSFEVDYYCLGALLFEMLVGCPPFYEPNSPETETKGRILYQEVEFPADFQLSDNVKDLIRKLLEKDPRRRLGHLGGTKEIKCHPWIGWLNREQWLSKQIEMPYPVNLDDFNFDTKDITVSANRMLASFNAQQRPKKKGLDRPRGSYLKKSDQILSPYRHNRQSLGQEKKSLTTDKVNYRSTATDSLGKKKKGGCSKPKDVLKALKACYLSTPKLNLSKFMRYPTEANDLKTKPHKSIDRKSFFKRDTEAKENDPQRPLRKRKPKEELIFMQIRRH
jgi:serine/threonine protein kinase